MDSNPTYRFAFVEHDNLGGPDSRKCQLVLLSGCPAVFARALAETLRAQPFISDVQVFVQETTERSLGAPN